MEQAFETWSAAADDLRIDYTTSVLNEIRTLAVDAFWRLPHGGLEIGGVLFGIIQPGSVRIIEQRPIECEYAKGPTFTLSLNDRQRLLGVFSDARQDIALKHLEPVGWYRSRTRSELRLSDGDLQFFDDHFAGPSRIALVLKPVKLAPTRATFFYRGKDGLIDATVKREILLEAPAKPRRPQRTEVVDVSVPKAAAPLSPHDFRRPLAEVAPAGPASQPPANLDGPRFLLPETRWWGARLLQRLIFSGR